MYDFKEDNLKWRNVVNLKKKKNFLLINNFLLLLFINFIVIIFCNYHDIKNNNSLLYGEASGINRALSEQSFITKEFRKETDEEQGGEAEIESYAAEQDNSQKLCEVQSRFSDAINKIMEKNTEKKIAIAQLVSILHDPQCSDDFDFKKQSFCKMKPNYGTDDKTKIGEEDLCGGEKFEKAMQKYVISRNCILSVAYKGAIFYNILDTSSQKNNDASSKTEGKTTKKGALTSLIEGYKLSSSYIDSNLKSIYDRSQKFIEDYKKILEDTINAFSSKKIMDVFNERRKKILGLMCASRVKANKSELFKDTIPGENFYVVKANFGNLIDNAIVAFKEWFQQLGKYFEYLLEDNGAVDILLKIHNDFQNYRFNRISRVLEKNNTLNFILSHPNSTYIKFFNTKIEPKFSYKTDIQNPSQNFLSTSESQNPILKNIKAHSLKNPVFGQIKDSSLISKLQNSEELSIKEIEELQKELSAQLKEAHQQLESLTTMTEYLNGSLAKTQNVPTQQGVATQPTPQQEGVATQPMPQQQGVATQPMPQQQEFNSQQMQTAPFAISKQLALVQLGHLTNNSIKTPPNEAKFPYSEKNLTSAFLVQNSSEIKMQQALIDQLEELKTRLNNVISKLSNAGKESTISSYSALQNLEYNPSNQPNTDDLLNMPNSGAETQNNLKKKDERKENNVKSNNKNLLKFHTFRGEIISKLKELKIFLIKNDTVTSDIDEVYLKKIVQAGIVDLTDNDFIIELALKPQAVLLGFSKIIYELIPNPMTTMKLLFNKTINVEDGIVNDGANLNITTYNEMNFATTLLSDLSLADQLHNSHLFSSYNNIEPEGKMNSMVTKRRFPNNLLKSNIRELNNSKFSAFDMFSINEDRNHKIVKSTNTGTARKRKFNVSFKSKSLQSGDTPNKNISFMDDADSHKASELIPSNTTTATLSVTTTTTIATTLSATTTNTIATTLSATTTTTIATTLSATTTTTIATTLSVTTTTTSVTTTTTSMTTTTTSVTTTTTMSNLLIMSDGKMDFGEFVDYASLASLTDYGVALYSNSWTYVLTGLMAAIATLFIL